MYLYDYDNRSMKLIIKITRRFDDLLQEEIKKNNLKVSFHKLLSEVYDHNGANQYELARILGLKAPSISAMLRQLESEEYVKRKVDPFDGRATKVYITEYGSKVEERIKAFEDKLMESFLSSFTEEERFKLIDLLEVIDKTEVTTLQNL